MEDGHALHCTPVMSTHLVETPRLWLKGPKIRYPLLHERVTVPLPATKDAEAVIYLVDNELAPESHHFPPKFKY